MDLGYKIGVLADAAKYDASCSSSGSQTKRSGKGIGSTEGMGICHSYTPDGRCISLLKILLTNYCIYDCKYCVNRVTSDVERARFTVEEIVKLTLDFYRRNYIEGLFLSSGIIQDSDYTMGQLIAVARSLRITHGFKGYIHLKTIPNTADALLIEAGLYADRLSVNIELPTQGDLDQLAPEKKRPQLERNMRTVLIKATEIKEDKKRGLKPPLFVPAGQSTQMIVGATPTPDKEILTTSFMLYTNYRLKRVYYSAFSPIPHADASLPGISPPLLREHRLYQADWLLRFYGFKVGDIVSDVAPQLDLDIDPKTAWALRNPDFFPIDVNRAPREHLLRIPGIGVQSVNRILSVRRYHFLRLEDLLRLRVAWKRTKPFITLLDYKPALNLQDSDKLASFMRPEPQQLQFDL